MILPCFSKPVRRITVFKSLILSKVIHILQSLPSPKKEFLKELEKLAYNFIWRNKRHQVSKSTLTRNTEDGGLNMIDIADFDKSLKITWLLKLQNSDPEWKEFATNYKIDRLIWTGELYHKNLLDQTTNPIWRSVILSFTNCIKPCLKMSFKISSTFQYGEIAP